MSRPLEAFGIKQGHDAQHSRMADLKLFEPNKYFVEAKNLLTQIISTVLDKVIPELEQYAGRWNPGGFMVFPLGMIEDGSSLRLHVSPQGMKRDILGGPFIHNHGWHLVSKILAGNYSDTIYSLEKTSLISTDSEKNLLRLYETRRNPEGQDELVTNGMIVRATAVEERNILAGDFHTIEAINVYHKPTTPSEQLAATLVLDSPAFTNTTHVLLDNEGFTVERKRKPLDLKSIGIAKEQLKQALEL
jgi:hypothetical protein